VTLTELRYLVNLDKERHFGRAAERSFVSQPTLSVALKKLEDELGVVLFERNRGEARPTPVGERIIAQAKRVLAESQLLRDLAREGKDELTGALALGAIYTVGPYLLPALVPILRADAPRMPLVLEENFTAVLLEQLRGNELDAIILAQPFDADGLHVWGLYDEDFVVLMPLEHRFGAESAIPARRMAEEKLLLLGPGHCFRDQVIEACPKCVDPDGSGSRPHSGSSLETIRHMVASGLGVTVLPKSSVENQPLDPALVVSRPFAPPAPARRIVLAWRKTFPRIKALTTVRHAILKSGLKGVRFRPVDEPPT
jgi:LysR family transcriptional regulator, hydrogen peroxide-inducible genes activator